jgi:hypothetical protein
MSTIIQNPVFKADPTYIRENNPSDGKPFAIEETYCIFQICTHKGKELRI